MVELNDYFGGRLENGFYIILNPLGRDICYIEMSKDGNSFSAESWQGYVPINNFEEAAKNFAPFPGGKDSMRTQIRFVESKIEQLSKKP